MRLLHAVEGSVLFLSAVNPAAARNLSQEAASRNIDSGRLVFAPFLLGAEGHLARLTLADLFLDPLPYYAHATTTNTFSSVVPRTSSAGSTFAGRLAASF